VRIEGMMPKARGSVHRARLRRERARDMLGRMPLARPALEPRRRGFLVPLAALAAALLALAVLAPALFGGYLSDDLQLNYFLAASEAEPRLDWGEVLADVARPWLGAEGGATYRPLISLHYAFDLALGGADPRFALHASNLFFHALSSALVALLAAGLCAPRPALAALVAGALFALHPSCVETAAWIAGRVSGTQVAFSLLACAAFLRHLRSGSGSAWAASAAAAVLALGSKEGAVALPAAFLALEILSGAGAPLRLRIARHLGFLPLWIGYFALRWSVLGVLAGAPGATAENAPITLASAPAQLASKLRALVLPWLDLVDPAWAPLAGIALLGPLLVAACAGGRGARLHGACALWSIAVFLPSFGFGTSYAEGGLRLVYEAAAPLALGVACALGEVRAIRLRAMAGTAALLLALAFGAATLAKLDDYERGWDRVETLRTELASRAPEASAARPLALVATSLRERGVPIWNSNGLFPLVQRPFAVGETPLVALGCTFESVLHSESFSGDATPLRAVGELGIPLLLPAGEQLLEQRRDPSAEAGLPPEVPLGSGALRWVLAERLGMESLPPELIEGLLVRVDGRARGGTLRWISPLGPEELARLQAQVGSAIDPFSHVFGAGAEDGEELRFEIDLSASLYFFAHGLVVGGIRGFELRFDPPLPPEAVREVRLVRRVPELLRPTPLRGARVRLGDEDLALRAPLDVERKAALDLVLLGPHAALRIPVGADGRVRFGEVATRDLRQIAKLTRVPLYWFYFEERVRDGRARFSRRSRLDWFELELR
jgi:hypothetical protein